MNTDLFFEHIAHHFNNKLPFVAYRKPNETEVKAILQKDDTLHLTKDFTETGFVFAPFNTEEKSVLIPLETSVCLNLSEKFEKLSGQNISLVEALETNQSEAQTKHIALVKKGIAAIADGQFQKVIVSRCESVTLSENNPIEIFKRLLYNYQAAFVYCWYHPLVGLWLGATPETLLKTEGNRLETMALAGTKAYNGSLKVAWQAKEKEEQQIVTDSIVTSLEHSVNNLIVSETETIKAGSLLHLKTSIKGILNPKRSSLKQLLFSIHPTPAICGLPKDKAKQFILDNETYNRAYYTGFLGELNFKETRSRNTNRRNVENSAYASVKIVSNLFVNLRCMQLKKHQALIYVGGGITKDSIPENEWEETINKAKTIKNVLVN